MKRVLVTGAGGFIGSHLTEKLVKSGVQVRALVHYNSIGLWGWLDESKLKEEIEFIAGDITDPFAVKKAMEGVDTVFHLAALIGIPYSYLAPASYVKVNIEGTLNVLEAAKQLNVERILHTSTSETYGTAQYVPIDEKHPLVGQSPYSASKIGADKMCESYHLSFGVPAVTIRPFNTFGPRQSARAIIPTIISQCLWGNGVIRLGNTAPTRDLNFVDNIVDGYLAAANAPSTVVGKAINLGSGKEINIGDLAKKIVSIIDDGLVIDREEKRKRPTNSEVRRLVADNNLAKTLLDWQPEISLDQGLETTIAWIKENKNRYRPDTYSI